MKFNRQIFLLLSLLSNLTFAQTDSLRYDQWIAWVTPTSAIHVYHPAIEIGAEYNSGNQWAYVLQYGIRSMQKKELYYQDQSHQYLRLGVKRYFAPKFNSGYIMPELGLFHLSHKGTAQNVIWRERNRPSFMADARFHDFYVKTGALLGRKMKAGDLRFDLFAGAGVRFTFRHHKLHEIIEGTEGWKGNERHTQVMHDEIIRIHTPNGWKGLQPLYYLSLGLRLGIGVKPVKTPVESVNFPPGS